MATDMDCLITTSEGRGDDEKRLDQPPPAWGKIYWVGHLNVTLEVFLTAPRTTAAEDLTGQHASRSLTEIPARPATLALSGKWPRGWLSPVSRDPPPRLPGRAH
jgi:hypothetical protein